MSGTEKTVLHREAEPRIQGLIEGKELSRWQEHFCDIANVFICCVDSQGNPITEFGGNTKDKDRIKKIIDKEQLQSMLLRFSESTLEDHAI